ncbi:MAG: hypothetical protein FWB86_01665 [Treponema sp.]|nr:hypothetical protein [Treponema sp.]MCL2250809.1 hypothetical protein [Treponema sp.]
MKKLLLLPLLLIITINSFAQETPVQNAENLPNRRIFIEGRGVNSRQQEYFYINFRKEAASTGYPVVNNKNEAAYVFRFNITNNPNRDIDPNLYVMKISLLNNISNIEIISFDFFFSTLEEMDQHNRFIFFNAVSGVIPPLAEKDLVVVQEIIEEVIIQEIDTSWRDKWIYLRTGFDYPITFYALLPTGLTAEAGVYIGPSAIEPEDFQILDHKILAMPGISIGVEAQLLNFLSLGVNLQLSLGDTRDNYFVNVALGAELKFPLKFFKNFMIEPYGSFVLPITVSEIFSKFPKFALGGGVQISTRGGSLGAFFLDVKYLHSIGETAMYNPFGDVFPEPPEIHYNRFALIFSIGYKFGFLDKKPKASVQKPVQTTEFPESDSESSHIHIFDF